MSGKDPRDRSTRAGTAHVVPLGGGRGRAAAGSRCNPGLRHLLPRSRRGPSHLNVSCPLYSAPLRVFYGRQRPKCGHQRPRSRVSSEPELVRRSMYGNACLFRKKACPWLCAEARTPLPAPTGVGRIQTEPPPTPAACARQGGCPVATSRGRNQGHPGWWRNGAGQHPEHACAFAHTGGGYRVGARAAGAPSLPADNLLRQLRAPDALFCFLLGENDILRKKAQTDFQRRAAE